MTDRTQRTVRIGLSQFNSIQDIKGYPLEKLVAIECPCLYVLSGLVIQ